MKKAFNFGFKPGFQARCRKPLSTGYWPIDRMMDLVNLFEKGSFMDAFLPLEDTAHRLSVARRTIARWIVEGKLKVTYNPSGRPIISLSSIKSLEEKIFTVARTVQREEEQALGPAES